MLGRQAPCFPYVQRARRVSGSKVSILSCYRFVRERGWNEVDDVAVRDTRQDIAMVGRGLWTIDATVEVLCD